MVRMVSSEFCKMEWSTKTPLTIWPTLTVPLLPLQLLRELNPSIMVLSLHAGWTDKLFVRYIALTTLQPKDKAPSKPHRPKLKYLHHSDELKVSTDGQAYVYAISPNRDLAVITGGHAADGVFWIDDETGAWCTSDYYCSLPEWVNKRDLYQPIENIIKNTEWTPLNDNVTYFSYFLSGKSGKAFKRKFNGDYRFMLFKTAVWLMRKLPEWLMTA